MYATSRQTAGELDCARLDADTAHRDGAGWRRRMLRNAADIAPSSIQRLRCGGPAGAVGQRGHHRRSLRTARSLSESPHVAAATGRGRLRPLAATTCPGTCIQPMKQAMPPTCSGPASRQRFRRCSPLPPHSSWRAWSVRRKLASARLRCTARAVVGLGQRVVRRCARAARRGGRRHFSSAFVASIAIGCIAALLQAAFGRPLAWSLADNRLVVDVAGPCAAAATRRRSGTGAGPAHPQSRLSDAGMAHGHRPGIGYADGRRQSPS